MSGEIFILLGSNIDNRLEFLSLACAEINSTCGPIRRKSSVYQTAPWGKTDQSAFLNQVIEIASELPPLLLLARLLSIEKKLGRNRVEKWGPREIDLDILFYADQLVNDQELILPHPEIPNRRFTLIPLIELSPQLIHPILNKTCTQLLDMCTDKLTVTKLS